MSTPPIPPSATLFARKQVRAAKVIQKAYRRRIVHHDATEKMTVEEKLYQEYFHDCLQRSKTMDWTSMPIYRIWYLGVVPHALVVVKRLAMRAPRHMERWQGVLDNGEELSRGMNTEQVQGVVAAFGRMLDQATECCRELEPEVSLRGDISKLEKTIKKVNKAMKGVPEPWKRNWEFHLLMAKPPVARSDSLNLPYQAYYAHPSRLVCRVLRRGCLNWQKRSERRGKLAARDDAYRKFWGDCIGQWALTLTQHPVDSRYKVWYLGIVPHLLVVLQWAVEFSNVGLTHAEGRFDATEGEDGREEAREAYVQALVLSDTVKQLQKNLKPEAKFHLKQDVTALRRLIDRVEEMFAQLPREVAKEVEFDMTMARYPIKVKQRKPQVHTG